MTFRTIHIAYFLQDQSRKINKAKRIIFLNILFSIYTNMQINSNPFLKSSIFNLHSVCTITIDFVPWFPITISSIEIHLTQPLLAFPNGVLYVVKGVREWYTTGQGVASQRRNKKGYLRTPVSLRSISAGKALKVGIDATGMLTSHGGARDRRTKRKGQFRPGKASVIESRIRDGKVVILNQKVHPSFFPSFFFFFLKFYQRDECFLD